jgi:hypothetical protein
VLRESVLPALQDGARSTARSDGGPRVVAVPRAISGADESAVQAARDEARSQFAFLYSTPAYQRTLELFGLREVGTRLSELAHEKKWAGIADVLTDDVVAQLVPQGTYAELPAVLASWYGGLCDGLAVDMPADSADDDHFAAMIEQLRTVPTKLS